MVARLPATSLGLLLALAGCAGTGSQPDEMPSVSSDPSGDEPDRGEGAQDEASPPAWSLGDWWSYRVTFPLTNTEIEARIVVHAGDADEWFVSTTDHELNLLAEFGHYPTLGPVKKANLHQVIHGADVPFFEWPLADGKAWTLPYRSSDATWTVTALDVSAPDGSLPGYRVRMEASSTEVIEFDYAPSVGWFVRLVYDFGGPFAIMELLDWGHNHTGDVSVLAFDEFIHRPFPVLVVDGSGPPAVPSDEPLDSFTVGTEGSLLWGFAYGGAAGDYGVYGAPHASPHAPGFSALRSPTDSEFAFEWGEIPQPVPGDWSVASGGEARGPGASVFFEALQVHETVVTF